MKERGLQKHTSNAKQVLKSFFSYVRFKSKYKKENKEIPEDKDIVYKKEMRKQIIQFQ